MASDFLWMHLSITHGFRTGLYDAPGDVGQFGVPGIAEEITQVAPMPDVDTMDRIIAALS